MGLRPLFLPLFTQVRGRKILRSTHGLGLMPETPPRVSHAQGDAARVTMVFSKAHYC